MKAPLVLWMNNQRKILSNIYFVKYMQFISSLKHILGRVRYFLLPLEYFKRAEKEVQPFLSIFFSLLKCFSSKFVVIVSCYLSLGLCLTLCIEFLRSYIGMKERPPMLCYSRHQREVQPTVRLQTNHNLFDGKPRCQCCHKS